MAGIRVETYFAKYYTASMSKPNIILSGLSRKFVIEGQPFGFEIYRLETEAGWSLEVIDGEGTSTVWDEEFTSDKDAYDCLMDTIENEGLSAFLETNVVPFPTGHS